MIYEIYRCDHPIYSTCTLYLHRGKGLAVIQQRFNSRLKATFWTSLDRALADIILSHDQFEEYFNRKADYSSEGLYPTVTVRQVMWALRMKPLKKQLWETRW